MNKPTGRFVYFTDYARIRVHAHTSQTRCVFRCIRSAVPGASDQNSGDPIRIRSEATRTGGWSDGGLSLGLGFQTFLAAHGRAAQGEHVRVVHEPVADGVGDSLITEGLVPTFRRKL